MQSSDVRDSVSRPVNNLHNPLPAPLLRTSHHTNIHHTAIGFEIYVYEALLSTVNDILQLETDLLMRSTQNVLRVYHKTANVSPVIQVRLHIIIIS